MSDSIKQEDRRYKVGFYLYKTGEPVRMDQLYPMTHEQACTFKSKMTDPANHFIYEVEPCASQKKI